MKPEKSHENPYFWRCFCSQRQHSAELYRFEEANSGLGLRLVFTSYIFDFFFFYGKVVGKISHFPMNPKSFNENSSSRNDGSTIWSPRNYPSTQCASFTDAFLQDLSIWCLPKARQPSDIHWTNNFGTVRNSIDFKSKNGIHYPPTAWQPVPIYFDSGITCHLFQRKMPHCKIRRFCWGLWRHLLLRNALKIGPGLPQGCA